MGRHHRRMQWLDEGDIELYHPDCRTRVLIIDLTLTRTGDKNVKLQAECICPTCKKYVYLAFTNGTRSDN